MSKPSKGGRMAQPSFMSEFSIAMEHGYNPEEMDAKLREVYGKTSQQIIDIFGPFAQVQDLHPPPEPDDSGREIVRVDDNAIAELDLEGDDVAELDLEGDDVAELDLEGDDVPELDLSDNKEGKKSWLQDTLKKGEERSSSSMLSNMAREQAVFERSSQVDKVEPVQWAFFELPGGVAGAFKGLSSGLNESMEEIMKYPYNLVAGPLDLKKAEMGYKWDYEQRKKRKNIINEVEEHLKKDLLKRRENSTIYNSITDGFTVTEAMFKVFLNTLGAAPVSQKSREWAKKTGAESENELAEFASFKESYDIWEEMIPGTIGTVKAYWDLATRGAIYRADEFKSPADQFMKTVEGFQAISTRPFTALMVISPALKFAKIKSKQANRAFDKKFNLPEKNTGLSYEMNRAILMAQDLVSAKFKSSPAFVAGRTNGVYKAAGLVGDHLNPYSFVRGMAYGDVVGGAAMGVGLAMVDSFLRSKLPKTQRSKIIIERLMNNFVDPAYSTVAGMSDALRSIYDSARFRQTAIAAEGRRLGKIIESSEAKVSIKDPGQPDFPGQISSKKKVPGKESLGEDYSPRLENKEASSGGYKKAKETVPTENRILNLNKADITYLLKFVTLEELRDFYPHLADVQAELIANSSIKSNKELTSQQHRMAIDQAVSRYQQEQINLVEAQAEFERLQDQITDAEIREIEEMKRSGEADIATSKFTTMETSAVQAFRQKRAAEKAVEKARQNVNSAVQGASAKQFTGNKAKYIERKSPIEMPKERINVIPGQSRASVKEAQGIGRTAPKAKSKQEWIREKHEAERSKAYSDLFGSSHLQRGFSTELEFHVKQGTLSGYIDDFIVASSKNKKGRSIENRPKDPSGEIADHAFEPQSSDQNLPEIFESPDHPAAIQFKKELIERVESIAEKTKQPSKKILEEADRLYPDRSPTGGVELKTKKGARKHSQSVIEGDAKGRVYYEVDGVATKAMGQSQSKGKTDRVQMEPDIKVLREGTGAFNDLKNVSKEMDGAIESLAKDEGYGAIEFEDGTVWINEDLVVNRGRAVEQTYPIPRKDMPRIEPNINVKSEDRTRATPTDPAELSKEYIQKNRVQMIMDINSRGQIEGSPRFSETHGRIIQSELKGGRKEVREKIIESIDEMFDLETKYDTTLPNELGIEKSTAIGRSKKEAQRVYLDVLRENSTFLYHNPKARKGLKESMGRDAGLKGPALKRFMEDGAIDEAILAAVRDSFKEGKLIEGDINPRHQSFAIKFGNKTVSMDMAGPRFVKHLKKTNPKALAKLQGEAVEIVIGGLARKNAKLTFLKTIGDMVDHRPAKEIAKSMSSGKISPILNENVTTASIKGEINKLVSKAKIEAAKLYKEAQSLKEKGASKEIYNAKMEEYRVANSIAKDIEKNTKNVLDRYEPVGDGLRDLRNEISQDVYRGKEAQFEADIGGWSSDMLVDKQVIRAIKASKFALNFASDAANVNKVILGGAKANRYVKRSYAVLNPGTVARNFGQAVSAIALQEGRLPSSVIIDIHRAKKFWESYIEGKEMSPHDKRVARIMRDSGAMDLDAAIQEMGDIFSSNLSDSKSKVGSAIGKTATVARRGLDKAQKPYRYGDVAPRSYMMQREINTTIKYMDMMKPGEHASLFVDPNKSITIFKNKDGSFSLHGKKLTTRQTERMIGRAAKVRPDLTIFDYGDIPKWHRYIREVPIIASAFPTWVNKAAYGNRKNLALTLIDGNGGTNFITNNAAVNAEIAAIHGKTALNRAMLSATAIPLVRDENDAHRKHMAFDPSSGEIRSTISKVVRVEKNGRSIVKTIDITGAQGIEGMALAMRVWQGLSNAAKRVLTVGYSSAKKYFSDAKDADNIWISAEKEGGDPAKIKKAKEVWIRNKAYGDFPIRDTLTMIGLAGDLLADIVLFLQAPRTRATAYDEEKVYKHLTKGILTGVGEPLFTAAVDILMHDRVYADRPFDDHLQTVWSKMSDQLKGLSFRTFVFGGGDKDKMSYHNEKLDEAIKASVRVGIKKKTKAYERDVARWEKAAKLKQPGAEERLKKAKNALKNSRKTLGDIDKTLNKVNSYLGKRRKEAMDNFVTRSLQ